MWTVDIDGTNITSLCQSISWRPKLNRPASLVVRVPGQLVTCTIGVSEMHLTNGSLLFSGPIWYVEDDGEPQATYTQITAYDHLIYLPKRLCKTGIDYPDPTSGPSGNQARPDDPGPCNLADPRQVIIDFATAPAIMGHFIDAANDCDLLNPGGTPFPLVTGSVASGGDDLGADISGGLPVDFPMTLQAMADLLLQTRNLNMIVNPGYGSSTVDLTNGGVVNDLTGSVSLNYATGSFNSQSANRTRDMEEVINALWYLLGPKRPWYKEDISHWGGSITPTAPNGGPDGDGDEPGDPWPPALVARWMGSRSTYGYMQEIQIHDSNEDEQITSRPAFETMFAGEAYVRAVPRTFVGVKPERESGGGVSFKPGDRISVSAGSKLGGGFSGSVIVYEYEISIDADGVAEFTDIVATDDQ
jgi:hypothetical protein